MKILVRKTEDYDMLLHMVTTDMKLLVVEIEIDDMTADDVDKMSWSTDVEKSKQVDLKVAHASIELHLHDIHVVQDKHEVDQLNAVGIELLICECLLFIMAYLCLVPWSSRLLRYAKSRPNGKLIHNSILNGSYVRRMIPEPGDTNCEEIWLRVQQMMKGSNIGIQEKKAKLFNEWESRHVTIVHQTKDLHTADYTQLYDFLKYNKKEVDELKAERIAKTQDHLALMANSNNPYAFLVPHQDQLSLNQNYLQQPMPNPKDITDPTTAMNMELALMAKAFKLNNSTPTNNN
nr:hypothetical protein [Tanacetum cinerariifolium]